MNDSNAPHNDEPDRNQEAHLARAMALARRGMRKYSHALRELAKQKGERSQAKDEA